MHACWRAGVAPRALLAAWIGLFSALAVAGGLYLNEFATPSMGNAGAGSQAWASDASTAFHNPAGMTRLDRPQLGLGAGLLVADVKFDPDPDTPVAGNDGGHAGGLGPILSLNATIPILENLSFGLNNTSISGTVLDYDDEWAGRYQVQEIRVFTAQISPSLAYKLNDRFSIGDGPVIMYGDIEMEVAGPPTTGTGRAKIDVDAWEVGFRAGALLQVTERTRLGLLYQSELDPDYSGSLELDPADLDAATDLSLPFPQMVRASVYHELNNSWALLGSVGWEDWSQVESILLSTEKGTTALPRNWRDTHHISAGVHYRPHERWLFQTGVAYDSSPVDKEDRTADMPMDRQIRLALGAQYDWSEDVTVGGSFVYADYGDAEIDGALLKGDYSDNDLFFFALNANWKF